MNYQERIEGMSCNGCANTVKSALETIDGVTDVAINLNEKQADIESVKELDENQINQALSDTSYTVKAFK
ncbi:heavy-metal-associated domain-containing protein [Alkalibacterium kapii]|uniref:HMA domain-containing protein n=1 Tax=Alkalibacterium kapii TaxID=426704 RepID=A0A511AVC2_9LACT|nr:heavy metal-associated domain-containing protein [Alkalibacterium kapii]GEK91293.1 hypothetical protein AKA01nite_09150 [Alkalibacterium kapii]